MRFLATADDLSPSSTPSSLSSSSSSSSPSPPPRSPHSHSPTPRQSCRRMAHLPPPGEERVNLTVVSLLQLILAILAISIKIAKISIILCTKRIKYHNFEPLNLVPAKVQ